MLLVTGGTGFIGRATLRRLSDAGYPVRILLRPARQSPRLPRGVSMEVALAGLTDRRGIRASLVGVDTVVHLAGSERLGAAKDLMTVDVEGTRTLAEAAAEAGVRRFIFLSHIGADRSAAYPLMRAKALAEDQIRSSGVPFTILRSGIVYGAGDRFTTSLAALLAVSPLAFPIPGAGSTLLQPLWVEDLATGITWSLDEAATLGQTYEIGGPEFLTFREVVQLVMAASGVHRLLIPTRPPYLRAVIWLMERSLPRPPVTTLWLDYLAVNRAAELSTLPRVLGLQPSRMRDRLGYLKGRRWGWDLVARQIFASDERDL